MINNANETKMVADVPCSFLSYEDFSGMVLTNRRRRDIDLALYVRLVRPFVRHNLVGAICQRLLQI